MTLGKKLVLVIEGIRSTTGVVAKILWVSFALLVFGISTAYAAQPGDKNAKPDDGEMTDGWLYLGRRSADRWRPLSFSISPPRYPVKPGDKVVVKQDALVYGSVDCKVIDVADFKADGTPQAVLRVKADKKGLEFVGSPIECPSIGRAKTVWANVKIPTARLASVEK